MTDGAADPTVWRPDAEWTPAAPETGTVDIWILDLTARPEDWKLLDDEETESARRVRVEGKRHQKVAGRAHLRRILGRVLGRAPADLTLEYGPHGKPILPDVPGLEFNLSHTSRTGLVAVTWNTRVGVDVEKERDLRLMARVAERFFAVGEYEAWSRLPESERRAAFFRLWTLKEAYLKAWGTGLTFASSRFEMDAPAHGDPRLVRTEMPGDDGPLWRFHDLSVRTGFAGAVCYEGSERPLRCWTATASR